MKKEDIVILGGGLSGLATSYFLRKRRVPARLFERDAVFGGLCKSIRCDGFLFDIAGHLLHFRSRRWHTFVQALLHNNLKRHTRAAGVYAGSRVIPFPFQQNYYRLPKAQRLRCEEGLREVQRNAARAPSAQSFLSWVYGTFGKGIAEQFMVPYNNKFWNFPLEDMATDWARRFIVPPARRTAANRYTAPAAGYNASFWYPVNGGMQCLVDALVAGAGTTQSSCDAYRIDLASRRVYFRNGRIEPYSHLVSSVPLPELGRMLTPVPRQISRYFASLRWTSLVNVNLGLERPSNSRWQWIYYPGVNIPFYRIVFPHMFSQSTVPVRKSALAVEVSCAPGRRHDAAEAASNVIVALRSLKVIGSADTITAQQVNSIAYAYPISTRETDAAREAIITFLRRHHISVQGRFGSWRYFSMEDVLRDSYRQALTIASR